MARHLVLVFASLLVLTPNVASAWHKRTPVVLRIAPASTGTIAHPSWAGYRYVLFDSDADIVGDQSTGRQIFMFDLQTRDKSNGEDLAVARLTADTPEHQDHQRASSGMRGRTIVYDASVNGKRQLFLIDRGLKLPQPLTQGADDSLNARMDDGSGVVVFESRADFFGTGVGGTQIYRIELEDSDPGCPYPCLPTSNRGLTQITHKVGTSRNAATSKRGKVIAFESDADLLDEGETETQVYRVDFDTTNDTVKKLARLSHGPGASRNPTLSRTGGHIAFESDADLMGTPEIGGTQIYVHRYQRKVPVLDAITAAQDGHSTRPSYEFNGKALIFISDADLAGTESTGHEVFVYDAEHKTTSQVTNVAGFTSDPAFSAGVFTAFLTDTDLVGDGTSGLGLYLVNLFALGSDTVP